MTGRPLYTPFELATVTGGTWLKSPGPSWNPEKVWAPVDGVVVDLNLKTDISFLRAEVGLKRWFANGENPGGEATGCLVLPRKLADSPFLPRDRAILLVDGVGPAVNALALHARTRMRGKLAVVTGTVGKTTTRSMLRHALQPYGSTIANFRNLNTKPYILQQLASAHERQDFAVFECGLGRWADSFRELAPFLQPDVFVMTQLDIAHLDLFTKEPVSREEGLKLVAGQKLQLSEAMKSGAPAVLNAGMPMYADIRSELERRGLSVISFGEADYADVSLRTFEADGDRYIVGAIVFGRPLRFALRTPGRFMAANSLAAIAAAAQMGVPPEDAAAALESFKAVAGRARVLKLNIGGRRVTVIDDSFNATPLSMRSSLSLLNELQPSGDGRRIAVLGDIAHLGSESASIHSALAKPVAEYAVDQLYTCGSEMAHLHGAVPAAVAAGHFESAEAVVKALLSDLRAGDVLTIKASVPSGFQVIVRALEAAAS